MELVAAFLLLPATRWMYHNRVRRIFGGWRLWDDCPRLLYEKLLLNEPELCSNITVSPTNLSDHHMVQVTSKIPLKGGLPYVNREKIGVSKYVFEENNWPQVHAVIRESALDEALLKANSIEEAYGTFLKSLEEICESLAIPHKKSKQNLSIIPKWRKKMYKKGVKL